MKTPSPILIFSLAYHPFVGGAEVAIKEITDRTTDIEYDMLTVNLDGKQKSFEKIGNINVYRIGKGTIGKFLFPFLAYKKAISLNRTKNYKLVWTMMANQASVGASFFKMRKSAIPLVLTIQEGDEESHLKRYVFGNNFLYKLFIRPWHILPFKKADHITVISNYLKDRALASGAKCPIDIVPNGVDLSKFQKEISQEEKNSIRKNLGVDESDTLLITTSRLVQKNAVGDIIQSLVSLPNNVKFLIIGDGADRRMLENMARAIGVSERTIFFGSLSQDDIPKYLKSSDIFIRPSLSEGMGNSFIEAMASGIPVIATAVGGITDFLIDQVTGLFCEVKNPKSIAEKVKLLMADKTLVATITTSAKKMVEERYSWNKIAGEMKVVFNKHL